jgi:hypothetical protein
MMMMTMMTAGLLGYDEDEDEDEVAAEDEYGDDEEATRTAGLL